MIKRFLTVGGWTFMSRVLGFARDVMMAAFLGTGPVAEAFVVAFSLPNLFRRFFAEGAFNMAFVPMFSKKLERGDDPLGFARDALVVLALILLALSAVAVVLMPWLVWAMASGFSGDTRFDLTVIFGRIAFPYIFFISLAALASGVLNAAGHFRAAAAAPVLLNVIFIAVLAGAAALSWDIGLTLAWAVPVAGVAQMALVWGAAARAGFVLWPRWPRWTDDLKRLSIIAAPAALAGGVVQINLLVGRQVASYFEGANAWLYYADRLYQLPLGVVGIAVGIVLLPELSRRLAAQDGAGGRTALTQAVMFSLALTVPCAFALVAIPDSLISVLFGRGAFAPADVQATALACAIYGLGLPAFVLQKTYQPLYFAREDTKTPFYFALVSLGLNLVIAVSLSFVIGFTAAAWGTTLSAWGMLLCLYLGARRLGDDARLTPGTWGRGLRIVVASAIMAVGLIGLEYVLQPLLAADYLRYAALAALVLAGAGIYAGAALGLRAFALADLRGATRR